MPTFTTTFLGTENPISEAGAWINGAVVGLDWTNCRKTPGLAFGTMPGNATGASQYADSTAILTGDWGPTQTASGVVRVITASNNASIFQEVELRLRFNLSAHVATGYEINASIALGSNSNYIQINRWDGALDSFTGLGGFAGHCVDGDTLAASINGGLITVTLNGSTIITADDSAYISTHSVFGTGNPGMGFFLQGATGLNANYGWSSFTATATTGTGIGVSTITLSGTSSAQSFGSASPKRALLPVWRSW